MRGLGTPDGWNLVAEGYDAVVAPMFQEFSRRALERLELAGPSRVLDVACGPGTSAALLAAAGHEVDAIDFSEAMIARLRGKLAEGGALVGATIRPHVMDGQQLGFDSGCMRGALSLFGLMFFPERSRGFAELHRVLAPGARACVSSWLPMSEVPAMQWLFGALSSVMPATPADTPPPEPLLEDPEVFASEMRAAGFVDVEVERCSASTPFPDDLATFWQWMVESSAPVALLRAKVGEQRWATMSETALANLRATKPDDLEAFTMHAWLGVGRKAG